MISLSTATSPTRLALLNPERSGSGKQVVNLESCFFRWGLELTLNALLHTWNKRSVAELLPTVFRVVYGHDRPTALGSACGMEQLALWQATACGMNLDNRLVVLALRSAGKEMDDTVRHDELRSVEGVLGIRVYRYGPHRRAERHATPEYLRRPLRSERMPPGVGSPP